MRPKVLPGVPQFRNVVFISMFINLKRGHTFPCKIQIITGHGEEKMVDILNS